ncbi:MAG: hypothetical protein AB1Z23_03025 [Eubacteriales bacterium]
MENISYEEQIIWGTSLGMASEDEIKLCHDIVKNFVISKSKVYQICESSKSTKNFIDIRWECGEVVSSLDLCEKEFSIKKELLAKEIECIVEKDLTIDGETVVNALKKNGYITICRGGQVFFNDSQNI